MFTVLIPSSPSSQGCPRESRGQREQLLRLGSCPPGFPRSRCRQSWHQSLSYTGAEILTLGLVFLTRAGPGTSPGSGVCTWRTSRTSRSRARPPAATQLTADRTGLIYQPSGSWSGGCRLIRSRRLQLRTTQTKPDKSIIQKLKENVLHLYCAMLLDGYKVMQCVKRTLEAASQGFQTNKPTNSWGG